jgi:hypothetical protein
MHSEHESGERTKAYGINPVFSSTEVLAGDETVK